MRPAACGGVCNWATRRDDQSGVHLLTARRPVVESAFQRSAEHEPVHVTAGEACWWTTPAISSCARLPSGDAAGRPRPCSCIVRRGDLASNAGMDFGHLIGLRLAERDDPLTVCRIEPAIAAALGASTDEVQLSRQTLQKQDRHHGELTHEHYRALPLALVSGQFFQDARRTAVVLFTDTHFFNANFRACIKATTQGHEL